MRKLLPYLALIFLGVIWGGVMSVMKFINLSGFPTFNYVFWVLLTSTTIAVAMNFANTGKLPSGHLRFYLICGLTCFAVPQAMMYLVLEHIPAGLLSLLLATTPIITFGISLSMRVETYHNLKVIGVIMGFSGAALIIVPNAFEEFIAPVGITLAAMIPAAFYAFYTSYFARHRPPKMNMLESSAGMLIAATAMVFAVLMATESFVPLWEASGIQIVLVLYHGCVTALAITTFNKVVKHSGALFASMATYSVTFFGIIFGALFHDEVLSSLVWIAAALILGGLGFIQRGKYLSQA